jgi:MFS family permease
MNESLRKGAETVQNETATLNGKIKHVHKVKNNIKKMILVNFFMSLIFFTPIIVFFLQERGLNYSQIFFLGAISSVFMVTFEIPSGIMADKIGRKKTLVLSNLLWLLMVLVLSAAWQYIIFVLVAALEGIAVALLSGSSEALIYDSLVQEGMEEKAKAVFGKMSSAKVLATAIAPSSGSVIAKLNLVFPVYLSAIAMFIGTVISFTLHEPATIAKNRTNFSFVKLARESLKILRNKTLLMVVLNYSIVAIITRSIIYLSQPHFKQSGIDMALYGLILSLAIIISSYAAVNAHEIEKKVGVEKAAFLTSFIPGILFLLMSYFYVPLISMVSVIGIILCRTLREPLFIVYRNRYIQSHNRATVLSFAAFLQAALGLLFKPMIGYATDISLFHALVLCGLILIFSPMTLRFRHLSRFDFSKST